MTKRRRRKCLNCRRLFRPGPRNVRHQRYCSEPACRKASKMASQARWLAKPQNRNYFRGPVHVARVTAWRAAFDGGYASRANLKAAKALGIEHVVFHKKRGLKVEDMTRSSWLYGQLKRFRAGVEAGISYLKRCFGLGRCLWRGLPRFKAYVQSAVFAHNLMRLVRLHPKPA